MEKYGTFSPKIRKNAKMFTFIISIYLSISIYKAMRQEKERVKFRNQVRLSFIGVDKIVYNKNPK